MLRRIILLVPVLLTWVFVTLPVAGRAEVPAGYYEGIEGMTGGELKQALHAVIRRDHRFNQPSHQVIYYSEVPAALRVIWRDPSNAANIKLVYGEVSVPASSTSWNREHLWPQSRGVASGSMDWEGLDYSDLFHVVPADVQVNTARSNRYFDTSDPNDPNYIIPVSPSAPQVSRDSDSWQPAPEERGDIARAMFYMEVRYNGSDVNTTDLQLVSFPPSGPQMGKLNTLLLWHAEDPPDDLERTRNDLIYANYQGNRNPFIDRPELVEAIWGSGIPGDPLNIPLGRIEAVSSTASEQPAGTARVRISLNQFAGAGGLNVRFAVSGTAEWDEFVLSGDVVDYDSITGEGIAVVQEGYATALILLTPVADGEPEEAETAIFTLLPGDGYEVVPDASSVATVTIRDSPTMPVAWNFNSFSTTESILPANSGEGHVSLAGWNGTVAAFGGVQGSSLSLVGQRGNGSWIDFHFSMSGYRDLSLGFATQGTATGFNVGTWSFSTDGLNFATLAGVNTATRNTSFLTRSVDFSPFASLNNAAEVVVRYTLSGATSNSGNNRIDNLTFNAMQLVTGDALREASVVTASAGGLEQPPTPAVFSIRLNGLAPEGGLFVDFALSGTALPGVDYEVTDVAAWDPATGGGRVYFEENEDTKFVGILPVDDRVEEEAETVVLVLPAPAESLYLLGPSTTATATIRDRRLNDNFSDAFVITGLPVSTTGSNVGATREVGEPRHFGTTGSASVWWRWTAPSTGLVGITTTGSSFDTILAVYTGGAVGALTRLASDDDSGGSLTSRILLNATAGTTYMIAVDGYGSATGNITLSLALATAPEISSFTPSAATPGASVTINGYNLALVTGVDFGGVPATEYTLVSDTRIVATVPENAVSGNIGLTSPQATVRSSGFFAVTRRPGVVSVVPDRERVEGFAASSGSVSAASSFQVSAAHLPGPLRVVAPAGFEISLDGNEYARELEIAAPERTDQAENYGAGWSSNSNGGNGFLAWRISSSQGSGRAGVLVGNPSDAGLTSFGEQAFSVFAEPVSSGAFASARRGLAAPLAVGETFSLRWAVNWDTDTTSGYKSLSLQSGGATVFTVRHEGFPGLIRASWSGSGLADTGLAFGTAPMRWSFTLLDATTLRVTATGRNGGSEIVYQRDIPVAGAPDAVTWQAYQVEANPLRRAYFNDLSIDSAAPGGGMLPSTAIHLRLAADAAAGNVSGAVELSSGGQSLAWVAASGTVTGATSAYDAWAQSHGLDPQGNGARAADPDGDGHSNWREFLFGAPPAQATGSLWRHEMQTSGLVLTFLGRETGVSYKLMSTVDLAAGTWTEESLAMTQATDQDGVPPGHKRRQVIVPNPSGTRFFRLQAGESSP